MENLEWVDKINDVDDVNAEDINLIAHYAQELNKNKADSDFAFDYYYEVASFNLDADVYQTPGIHKINILGGTVSNQAAIIITMKYVSGLRQLVLHPGYIKTRAIRPDGTLMDWNEYVLSSTLNAELTTKADKTVISVFLFTPIGNLK